MRTLMVLVSVFIDIDAVRTGDHVARIGKDVAYHGESVGVDRSGLGSCGIDTIVVDVDTARELVVTVDISTQ